MQVPAIRILNWIAATTQKFSSKKIPPQVKISRKIIGKAIRAGDCLPKNICHSHKFQKQAHNKYVKQSLETTH